MGMAWTTGLFWVVVTTLATPVVPPFAAWSPELQHGLAHAAESPQDRFDDLGRKGNAAAEAGDFVGAVDLWTRALRELPENPEDDRNHLRRGSFVLSVVNALEKAATPDVPPDQQARWLTDARRIAIDYLAELDRVYGADAATKEYHSEIRDWLDELDKRHGGLTLAPAAEEAAPTAVAAKPSDDQQPSKPVTGLLVAGGVAGATGVALVGVMIAGVARGRALEREDPTPAHPADEIRTEGERANQMAWVGGILGGASLVAGAVMLVVGLRRRARALEQAVAVVPGGFAIRFGGL